MVCHPWSSVSQPRCLNALYNNSRLTKTLYIVLQRVAFLVLSGLDQAYHEFVIIFSFRSASKAFVLDGIISVYDCPRSSPTVAKKLARSADMKVAIRCPMVFPGPPTVRSAALRALTAAEVLHYREIAWPDLAHAVAVDMGLQGAAVDPAVEHRECDHSWLAQSCDGGGGPAVPEQDAGLQALAWGARVRVRFMLVDAQVSLVNAASQDQGRSGQRSTLSAILRCPGSPASQHGLTSLQIIRCRSKKHHGVPMPANTPALARSARISFSVIYEVPSAKPTISCACASMPVIRRFSAERSRCDRTRLLRSCWLGEDNPGAVLTTAFQRPASSRAC